MSREWRQFMQALRFVTHRSASGIDTADAIPPHEATRFVPLAGILVGVCGAVVFWLTVQIWPSSVAVVLSMLATVLATGSIDRRARAFATADAPGAAAGSLYGVFVVLIKYNVLMGLSAANVSFTLPEYVTLGLIMVAGHAASRALVVTAMATRPQDLTIALIIGLAPAALLGIPGLAGLVAAIVMRLALTAYVFPKLGSDMRERLDVTQQLTEVCFYLGALATWRYV